MYRLRELERNDIAEINSWRSSRELINNLGAPFRYINCEVDFKWYDYYLENRNKNVRCAIIDQSNRIIGLVSLTDIEYINFTANFHIMISENYRGSGGGRFATFEILKHAFLDLNLRRIELAVLESNNRAMRLYEKAGFKKEGVKRQAVYKNGSYVDLVLMAILKDEFFYEVAK